MSGTPFAHGLPRVVSLPGAVTRAYRGIFSPRCPSSKHFFNPTFAVPRVSPAQRSRQFHATSAAASQLSRMAASKQYRLLCLENPLLGKHTSGAVPPRAPSSLAPPSLLPVSSLGHGFGLRKTPADTAYNNRHPGLRQR